MAPRMGKRTSADNTANFDHAMAASLAMLMVSLATLAERKFLLVKGISSSYTLIGAFLRTSE